MRATHLMPENEICIYVCSTSTKHCVFFIIIQSTTYARRECVQLFLELISTHSVNVPCRCVDQCRVPTWKH